MPEIQASKSPSAQKQNGVLSLSSSSLPTLSHDTLLVDPQVQRGEGFCRARMTSQILRPLNRLYGAWERGKIPGSILLQFRALSVPPGSAIKHTRHRKNKRHQAPAIPNCASGFSSLTSVQRLGWPGTSDMTAMSSQSHPGNQHG